MRIAGYCAVITLFPLLLAASDPKPVENGTEWTFDIPGKETYSSVIPSTVTKIIKTGEGSLTFSEPVSIWAPSLRPGECATIGYLP